MSQNSVHTLLNTFYERILSMSTFPRISEEYDKSLIYYEVFLLHNLIRDLRIQYQKKKYKNKNLLYEILHRIIIFNKTCLNNPIQFPRLTYFSKEITDLLPVLSNSSYSSLLNYLYHTSQTFLSILQLHSS